MFGIDFSELMVILVVALIVIGPERLPKVARTFGHLWGRAQRFVNGVKADISREMAAEEFRQLQQEIQQEVMGAEQAASQIAQTLDQQAQKLANVMAPPLSEDAAQQTQPELPPEAQKKFPID